MAFSKDKAHEKAERYAAKGQHDKAAREYQAIVDHDPKDVRAWLMLADCLARSGDRPGALQRYLQVGNYFAEHRDHQKALAVYRQALNIEPARADIHFRCAKLNLELGRKHDAIASFEQVGQLQLQAGKVNDAIETYRQIADADPTIVSKRLRLAELYSREKMKSEAVEAFRQAGDVLLQSNRKADYVRVAERLLWHDNTDRPTIRRLAKVYLELGDPRRALMKLNGLLQVDQGDIEGLELLAETFIALGKPDKASSVLVELVRELGDGESDQAIRVLRRGLQWIPGDSELTRLLSQHAVREEPEEEDESAAEEGAPMELELGDSDVLELDEDDVIMEEVGSDEVGSDEVAAEAAIVTPSRKGSMTDSVMSEVRGNGVPASTPEDAESADLDKILFEARVYVKYRLFDHALEHVHGVLERSPSHVGALSLQARAFGELGRASDAADTHIEVARLVADRDPKLAREHLDAALEQVPGHPAVAAMLGDLEQPAAAVPSPAPSSESDPSGIDYMDDGDSAALELVDGGEEDFDIEISEGEPAAPQRHRPPVENRFGLSEAGPLPEDQPSRGYQDELDEEETGVHHVPEVEIDSDAIALELDRSPGPLHDGSSSEVLDHEFNVPPEDFADVPLGEPPAQPTPSEEEAMELAHITELVQDDETGLELVTDAEPSPEPGLGSGAEELDDMLADLDGSLGVESPEPEPEPEPGPAVTATPGAGVPSKVHPDISDDLAEVRFFLDQGLDEDAEAALADLKDKAPGHPEVAKLEAELAGMQSPAASVEESGAVPLLDLVSEEDAEADAYLSSIFSDEAQSAAPAPQRQVEVKARADDVAEANPRDHFDLGMAYREMGLIDEAVGQFASAAADPAWRSRALVMTGVLRGHRGETDAAIADFSAAIESATTDDERCEAQYELAVLYEKVGNTQAAIEQLTAVAEGYRDRDERLGSLQG